MFPNVRLLIIALLASVVTLSCAFAVFATFGVAHEPLARVPAVTAPLQLVANDTTPAGGRIAWGAPFGSTLARGSAPDGGSAMAAIPAASSAFSNPTALEPALAAAEPLVTGSIPAPPPSPPQTATAPSSLPVAEIGGSTGAPASEPQTQPAAASPPVPTAATLAEQAPPPAAAPVVAAAEPAPPVPTAPTLGSPTQATSTEPEAQPVDVTASAESVPAGEPVLRRLVRRAARPRHLVVWSPPRRKAATHTVRYNVDTPDHPVFQSAPPPQRLASVRHTVRSHAATGPAGPEDH